jgi:hypothetical protein
MRTRRGFIAAAAGLAAGTQPAFVQVSRRDPRYFELSDGRPYIPNGLNLCWPRWAVEDPLGNMDERYRKLAANGGNFARLWASTPHFVLDPRQPGEIDEAQGARFSALMDSARRHGIRVKVCLEHFRVVEPTPPQYVGASFNLKAIYGKSAGGPVADMDDYFRSEAGRALFIAKLDWYARHHAGDEAVFGWELWNEINAVRGQGWMEWTRQMLAESRRRFPRHLVMQSLGSFDRERSRSPYREMMTMPGNEVAQVHRYLDLGAQLDVCKGPMDVLAADAVRELRGYEPGRPVLLAESGAVEPNHTGAFKLYEKDTEGVLLHDVMFAAFFSGAAGPGHAWFWDAHVEKHDLWRHFSRFAEVVKGIDPRQEEFQVDFEERDGLRHYFLRGRKNTLAWIRDARTDWRTELQEDRAPEIRRGLKTTMTKGRAYDPWRGEWVGLKGRRGQAELPPLRRSLVVRSK